MGTAARPTVGAESPPAGVRAAAHAAFDAVDPAALVADLVSDSLLDHREPPVDHRVLRFQAPGVTVEVQVREVGSLRRITAQVAPPGAGAVSLRRREQQRTVEAAFTTGDLAAIVLPDVPSGLFSLLVHHEAAGRPDLQTAWVRF